MTLIISDDDVGRLLSMRECIDAMQVAFEDFSNGVAVNRPRLRYLARHPDETKRYFANVHVGAVPSAGIACVRAGSQIMRLPTASSERRVYENPSAFNWGLVILYSIETAEPLALMHEFCLSGLRVGATTGLSVDRFARKDAATVGLFGSGKQARRALEAILCVRQIRRVRVYAPTRAHSETLAQDMARPGLAIDVANDARECVQGADIVCCATSAMRPVFDGEWLQTGQFVVTMANSDVTNKRSEVDERTFERASAILVNDWESVIENNQTELLGPIQSGLVDRSVVFELGDALLGKVKPDLSGIVYYKNNSGLAIQFAAAGGLIYRKAIEDGSCKSIPTEWLGTDLSSYYEAGLRPSP